MRMLKLALAIVTAIAFVGCSSSMASVGGPVKAGGSSVKSEVSNMNILMLTTMSAEKASEAAKSLANQCSGGQVVGVTSHWKQTSYSVIAFETLSLSGYCEN